MPKTVIRTASAPAAIGPYSQATAAGGLLFASGQIAINPKTGELTGDVRAQARQALENLRAVLEAGGSSLDRVLKVTCFLADMADFGAVNEVYAEYFSKEPPARSAVAVAALPKGAKVEIEAIALC